MNQFVQMLTPQKNAHFNSIDVQKHRDENQSEK